MQKNLFIGAGLGVVVIALLVGYWYETTAAGDGRGLVASQQAAAPGTGSPTAVAPPATASQGLPGAAGATAPEFSARGGVGSSAPIVAAPWLTPSAPVGTTSARPAAAASALSPVARRLSREERARVRASINQQMAALLAKGPNATLADAQAFLDNVEKSSQGTFDPRYFAVMRAIIQDSVKTQALSQELNRISSSTAPVDVTRRTAILAELRAASDRLTTGSAAMQSYARDAVKAAGR